MAVAAHASSTTVWLREQLRISHRAARDLVALGAALDRSPALDRAVGSATVNPEQGAVIAAATADLAGEVDPEVIDEAEATLIGSLRSSGRSRWSVWPGECWKWSLPRSPSGSRRSDWPNRIGGPTAPARSP
jgi:hypothetical protein